MTRQHRTGYDMRNPIRIASGLVLALALVPSFASAQSATAKCPEVPALEAKVKNAPGNVDAIIELGKAYLCAGRYRDAQYTLEDAVALDYKSFDAHFHLGRALFEQGDPEAALFEYTQLAALYPDRMEPVFQQGVVYARLRKPDEAIKAFTSAIELGKKAEVPLSLILDAYLGLTAQQRAKKDFDGAAKSYTDALALEPKDPVESTLMLGKAQVLFEAGKINDALPIAYTLLKRNPGNVAAVMLVADAFEKQGFADRALREIDRSLESIKNPKDRAVLLTRRGLILQKMGRKTDAISAFTSATNANPDAWEAQYNLGVLQLATQPAEALTRFRAAAKLRPEDGEIQLNIAAAQTALKNYPAAYVAAKTAIPLLQAPASRARARLLAGQSAYLAGQHDDAAAELRQLVTADPGNYVYQQWYGLTLLALKDNAGAVTALENAVKISPSSIEARNNLGAAYLASKRYADAENVLRTVLSVDANNVDALTNLGLALANQGKLDEAKTTLAKAAALGSSAAKKALEALK